VAKQKPMKADSTSCLAFPKGGRQAAGKVSLRAKEKMRRADASQVRRSPNPSAATGATGVSIHDEVHERSSHDASAVVTVDRGEFTLGHHFKMTRTGLTVLNHPTFDVCADFSEVLSVSANAHQFAIGAFVNYVEEAFGEEASQIIDQERFAESTIGVYKWVDKKVSPDRRRPELSFAHHQLVAELQPSDQEKWLAKAVAGKMKTSELRTAIKGEKAGASHTRYFVTVEVDSEKDQDTLIRQLASLEQTRVTKVTKTSKAKPASRAGKKAGKHK
jgi:hypothetical protein